MVFPKALVGSSPTPTSAAADDGNDWEPSPPWSSNKCYRTEASQQVSDLQEEIKTAPQRKLVLPAAPGLSRLPPKPNPEAAVGCMPLWSPIWHFSLLCCVSQQWSAFPLHPAHVLSSCAQHLHCPPRGRQMTLDYAISIWLSFPWKSQQPGPVQLWKWEVSIRRSFRTWGEASNDAERGLFSSMKFVSFSLISANVLFIYIFWMHWIWQQRS